MQRRQFVSLLATVSGFLALDLTRADASSINDSMRRTDEANTSDLVHLAGFRCMRHVLSSQVTHRVMKGKYADNERCRLWAREALQSEVGRVLRPRIQFLIESSPDDYQVMFYDEATLSAVFADQTGLHRFGKLHTTGSSLMFSHFRGEPLRSLKDLARDSEFQRKGIFASIAGFYFPALLAQPDDPSSCGACGGHCTSDCGSGGICVGCSGGSAIYCCNIGTTLCRWCCGCGTACSGSPCVEG